MLEAFYYHFSHRNLAVIWTNTSQCWQTELTYTLISLMMELLDLYTKYSINILRLRLQFIFKMRGTVMRSPLLLIFANIFMEKLKKWVFVLSQLKLKRFVGSVWMITLLTSHIEAIFLTVYHPFCLPWRKRGKLFFIWQSRKLKCSNNDKVTL